MSKRWQQWQQQRERRQKWDQWRLYKVLLLRYLPKQQAKQLWIQIQIMELEMEEQGQEEPPNLEQLIPLLKPALAQSQQGQRVQPLLLSYYQEQKLHVLQRYIPEEHWEEWGGDYLERLDQLRRQKRWPLCISIRSWFWRIQLRCAGVRCKLSDAVLAKQWG